MKVILTSRPATAHYAMLRPTAIPTTRAKTAAEALIPEGSKATTIHTD
ncbi:hypothetical protein J2Y41_004527 [Arthrobacter sp. 1088]|nr:hypothetical protein [Arthrobacter sp. 1088]MDR6688929.1 hypothetical protein [Arthrobacter sp. 1088]